MSDKKEKSEDALKTWLVGAATDLVIGIILLILDKLLSQLRKQGMGRKPCST